MRKICPSISELQAFEAAVRHLSFARAADELALTPGAVSRQVRALEQYLGLELFRRVRKRLALTPAGHAYFARVSPCLDELQTATLEAVSYREGGGNLNLAVLPAFNARWLMPRLPRFAAAHPDIAVNFVSATHAGDMRPMLTDAAVRYGDGTWPQSIADYLIGRDVVIVCSRALAAGRRPIRTPPDVLGHTLLQHVGLPHAWNEWAEAMGIASKRPMAGLRLDQFSVMLQAARAGLGIALIPRFLVEDELARGDVIAPLQDRVRISTGYYLVYPEEKRDLPALHALRAWMLREIEAERVAAARADVAHDAHASNSRDASA